MSVTQQKFIRLEQSHRLKDYYNFAAPPKNSFLYGRINISASTKSYNVLLNLEKCPVDFHWMFMYNKYDFFGLVLQTEGWDKMI